MAPPSRLRAVLTEMFGIDIRSLVFFRVSLALMLLADLYTRLWDLEAFYTDFGVLPRDYLKIAWENHWYLCLHSFTGSTTGQGILFALAAIFAEAGLELPAAPWMQSGGRQGRHGEAMGYLLAELQYMQRTYPGAVW